MNTPALTRDLGLALSLGLLLRRPPAALAGV
jgi:hypothetical protein